jgi:hypothetical protein
MSLHYFADHIPNQAITHVVPVLDSRTGLSKVAISGVTIEGGIASQGGGSVCIDEATFRAIAGNSASISNPDIFGPFTFC